MKLFTLIVTLVTAIVVTAGDTVAQTTCSTCAIRTRIRHPLGDKLCGSQDTLTHCYDVREKQYTDGWWGRQTTKMLAGNCDATTGCY